MLHTASEAPLQLGALKCLTVAARRRTNALFVLSASASASVRRFGAGVSEGGPALCFRDAIPVAPSSNQSDRSDL